MDVLSKIPILLAIEDAPNDSCLLTVCQEVPVDNIVLAPQLLRQIASLTKCIWLKNIKRSNTSYIFCLEANQKAEEEQPNSSSSCGPATTIQLFTDHAQDRLPFVKSVEHQFSVPAKQVLQPTHQLAWRVLAPRKKRRQQGLIVQRCCSTEHALHYNNCRLNVSETNAFHKTCLKRLYLS